jgi:hypothetical protein
MRDFVSFVEVGMRWFDWGHWAYRPALDLPAERLCDLAHAVAGDTLNHVLAVRDNDGDALFRSAVDADEAGSGELVDLAPGGTVQVESDAEAFTSRLVAEAEHRSVVTTNLGTASTVGSSTVEVLENEGINRVNAVVHASRHDEDDESVLFGRAQAQLCGAAEQKRTDVHGRTCAVRRDILGVQADGELDTLLEVLDRDMGDGDGGGRVLHTLGVLLRAENVDGLVVRGAVGFQSLVALLAVVEAGCHAVDTHER